MKALAVIMLMVQHHNAIECNPFTNVVRFRYVIIFMVQHHNALDDITLILHDLVYHFANIFFPHIAWLCFLALRTWWFRFCRCILYIKVLISVGDVTLSPIKLPATT